MTKNDKNFCEYLLDVYGWLTHGVYPNVDGVKVEVYTVVVVEGVEYYLIKNDSEWVNIISKPLYRIYRDMVNNAD